mmetsp:Transcript_88266/g.270073  ORF Transcript_88266/g.270073 Transcript_88266/m.270073 type:complete len:209 (+) Transcript_88266:862-1488(+)
MRPQGARRTEAEVLDPADLDDARRIHGVEQLHNRSQSQVLLIWRTGRLARRRALPRGCLLILAPALHPAWRMLRGAGHGPSIHCKCRALKWRKGCGRQREGSLRHHRRRGGEFGLSFCRGAPSMGWAGERRRGRGRRIDRMLALPCRRRRADGLAVAGIVRPTPAAAPRLRRGRPRCCDLRHVGKRLIGIDIRPTPAGCTRRRRRRSQ